MTTRVWSIFQAAIFSFIQLFTGNLTIEAVAGSGKTTTLVQLLNYLRGNILYLAFSKAIADELRKRCPRHVEVRTLHSFGLHVINTNLPGKRDVRYGKGKSKGIAARIIADKYSPRMVLCTVAATVTSMAKNAYTDHDLTIDEILNLMAKYGVKVPEGFEAADVAELVSKVLEVSKRETAVIDGDDMIWLVLVLNLAVRRFDAVLIDEAQDLCPAQMELAARIAGKGGRVVVVGDRRQSIMAFRGADSSAMARLTERFGCKRMPLSVTYRCPRKAVELAQCIVPEIEAAPGAIDGDVCSVNVAAFKPAAGDMVLCRVTKHLVAAFFQLLRDGVKSFIKGRELGEELINFIEGFKADSLPELTYKIAEWRDRECQKLIDADKESQAEQARDKSDAVLEISLNCDTVNELIDYIARIFRADGEGVMLSTIHRAKGLEAVRVWILHAELMPHPAARQQWEAEQEENLAYVAFTRTLRDLYFVGSGPAWGNVPHRESLQ